MTPRLSSWLATHAPHWLKRPPFTTALDANLWLVTLITRPRVFKQMIAVHQRLRAITGVSCGTHFYGGISYLHGKKEFAHMHGDGIVDAYLGSKRATDAVKAGRAAAHHAEGGPGWVTMDLHKIPVQQVLKVIRPNPLEL